MWSEGDEYGAAGEGYGPKRCWDVQSTSGDEHDVTGNMCNEAVDHVLGQTQPRREAQADVPGEHIAAFMGHSSPLGIGANC